MCPHSRSPPENPALFKGLTFVMLEQTPHLGISLTCEADSASPNEMPAKVIIPKARQVMFNLCK
jgi:hypothetical protein